MKHVLYLLLALLVLGCGKEDELTPKLEIENLYGIQDEPSDSIKHRVFEIYQNYGVPVYFNDTIGQVFLKNDVNGKAVYRYETLDLAWKYSSYDGVTYEYAYMTDPDEQSRALNIIEAYLELVPKALYPFNFFVTDSAKMIDASDNETVYSKGAFENCYRTVLMTGKWTEEQATSLPKEMKSEILKSKILNYKNLLTKFNEISDPSWYYKEWEKLDPTYFQYVDTTLNSYYRSYFNPAALSDTWHSINMFTPEKLSEFRAAIREKIGQFGFVNGFHEHVGLAPATTDEDLVTFITEILRWSREEFEELWGECPLVMEKYEILYDVITNKIGVEL